MSEAHLADLQPQLQSIPITNVYAPDIPMAAVLQEGNDLLTIIREPSIWQVLSAVGVSATARESLEQALAAARTAQSRWTVARDRQKSDAQRVREERAQKERADLLAVCRYHLRDDRVALGTIELIMQGEGVADLSQDLSDLATLIEQRIKAFENDKTFKAAERVEGARSLASELSAGVSGERMATDQASAIELRDRAYTYLDEMITSLREAGRYAFRDDERLRKRFASPYLRKKKRSKPGNGATEMAAPQDMGAE